MQKYTEQHSNQPYWVAQSIIWWVEIGSKLLGFVLMQPLMFRSFVSICFASCFHRFQMRLTWQNNQGAKASEWPTVLSSDLLNFILAIERILKRRKVTSFQFPSKYIKLHQITIVLSTYILFTYPYRTYLFKTLDFQNSFQHPVAWELVLSTPQKTNTELKHEPK